MTLTFDLVFKIIMFGTFLSILLELGEYSAILSTFIKLPFSIKTFVVVFFNFAWSLKQVLQ